MGILHAVNRRGIGTKSIGFYTVLQPTRWFPASRLSDRFHDHVEQSAELKTLPQQVADESDCQGALFLSQTLELGSKPSRLLPRLMRIVFIILAAILIELAIRWLIVLGAPANRY